MRSICVLILSIVVAIGSFAPAFAEDLFVMSRDNKKILTIDSLADGAVTPTRDISGNTATTINLGYGLFLYNNELYMADDSTDTISVFDSSANGDVAPKRSFTEAFGTLRGIFITDNEIYVTDQTDGSVKVFDITASGVATAKRTIKGANTALSNTQMCVVYGGELYVLEFGSPSIVVFDAKADGDVAPKRRITSASMGASRGLWVDNGVIYVGDATNQKILTFPTSASGATVPTTEISTPGFSGVHSLLVKDGLIYAGAFSSSKIGVFKTTDNGLVTPQRTITSTDFRGVIALTMVTGGYVRVADSQQSGVTVSLSSSTENATTTSEIQSVFNAPANFDLKAPMGKFTATVSSNGANGVFRFNATSLNGTASNLKLLKCFEGNGTSMYFGDYAPSADPDTEGTWWLEDDSNNYIDYSATLTHGTNYWVNYVVKDNGKYDSDRALGSIEDPVVLGSQTSSGGCVMNPAAGLGLEWMLLGLGVFLSILRGGLKFRGKK